ncbi:MAG: hypothetical protein ACI9A7_000601 [Cyclobacteriaceae bacterium]|jgi:hypothetical protein
MKFLYSLLITLFVFSCGTTSDNSKDDLKTLKEEVMIVHDEVMPKMGALMKAKKQLLLKIESETDSIKRIKYLEVSEQIESANASMMDWMHNYEPNFEGNDEALKEYLNGKKVSIEKVKTDMLAALLAGEQSLSE